MEINIESKDFSSVSALFAAQNEDEVLFRINLLDGTTINLTVNEDVVKQLESAVKQAKHTFEQLKRVK